MIGIASRVEGPIKELAIVDNQFVHKGDLLFEIDAAPYKLSVDAAAANLAMAEGEVKNTQLQIASQQEQAKAAIAAMQQAQTAEAEAKDNYDRIAPLRTSAMPALWMWIRRVVPWNPPPRVWPPLRPSCPPHSRLCLTLPPSRLREMRRR